LKIVTDCAADMPPEELKQLDITQFPLFIQFPEGVSDDCHAVQRSLC
jgi:fatty acid-binding protein DegV